MFNSLFYKFSRIRRTAELLCVFSFRCIQTHYILLYSLFFILINKLEIYSVYSIVIHPISLRVCGFETLFSKSSVLQARTLTLLKDCLIRKKNKEMWLTVHCVRVVFWKLHTSCFRPPAPFLKIQTEIYQQSVKALKTSKHFPIRQIQFHPAQSQVRMKSISWCCLYIQLFRCLPWQESQYASAFPRKIKCRWAPAHRKRV